MYRDAVLAWSSLVSILGRMIEVGSYHDESANEHVGSVALDRDDLINEVGHETDDGQKRKELCGAQSRKGYAESAELRSLEAHLERDRLLKVGDQRKTRAGLVSGAQGQMRPRLWDGSRWEKWRGNVERLGGTRTVFFYIKRRCCKVSLDWKKVNAMVFQNPKNVDEKRLEQVDCRDGRNEIAGVVTELIFNETARDRKLVKARDDVERPENRL